MTWWSAKRPGGTARTSAAPLTSDIARVAAGLATALYELVEREEGSPEPVTFRIRSLQAEHGGGGDPAPAAIEVHLGRGEPGRARIEINLALYDNRLRARLLARIEEVGFDIDEAALPIGVHIMALAALDLMR